MENGFPEIRRYRNKEPTSRKKNGKYAGWKGRK
jgi:hypothetical protein